MKKFLFMTMALFMAVAVQATDVKTVVLETNMSCQNCANKIQENVRFEKGVKSIKTNVSDKTVTITYDADKTNVDNLIKGIEKVGYKASVAQPKAAGKACSGDCCKGEKKEGASCCGGEKKAEGSCCSEKKK